MQMSEKLELHVKAAIAQALDSGDHMISFYRARKSQSMYVILGHSQNQYLPIRVSNHRSFSGFQKVPTFVLRSQERRQISRQLFL